MHACVLVGVGWCVCVVVCWLVCASADLSRQNRGRPKNARRYRQSPLQYALAGGFAPLEAKSEDRSMQNSGRPKARAATARALYSTHLQGVSRPSRRKVRTVPRKTADVHKRGPLPVPRKTADVQKRAPLPPEPFRVRPCHGFAPLEGKS